MQPDPIKEALERKLAQREANRRFHELFLLVDRSGSGKGYSERRLAWQKNLKDQMRQMARDGMGINAIEKYIVEKIAQEENGSIR